MVGIGERLPDPGGRVAEIADQHERPVVPVFSDLGAGRGARRVLLTGTHVFFFPFLPFAADGALAIRSRCFSRVSTCAAQKRRKGTSQAASSISGSGFSR